MIVCDSCKQLGEPAYPMRLTLGLSKDHKKPLNSVIVIHYGYHPDLSTRIDLCEKCAKLLGDKIDELVKPMLPVKR